MEYANLLDIYDSLVEVSEKLHDDFDFDIQGFDKCLYMLHYALKNYIPINLHLENRRLSREIIRITGKYDEYMQSKNQVFEKNKELQLENVKLRALNKTLVEENQQFLKVEKIKLKVGFNNVEIDFEDKKINFLINTDTQIFLSHFNDAITFVYSKRKKRVQPNVIRDWFMLYYRSLGFNCVTS